ncbi:hypothetical protein EYC80_004854 [Monilinia laxa]|uniref:Uncharacterized protein n=1 Tax=Monilinia laxa TaxID=61186 RepID=A0A5N6KID4_MONLA|nr:hypothetical protein EYC80_004854 [Monilinia laxa]
MTWPTNPLKASTNPATFPCPTPKIFSYQILAHLFTNFFSFPSSLLPPLFYIESINNTFFVFIFLSIPNLGSVAGIYNLFTILTSGSTNHSSIYSFERVSNDKSIHLLL